MLGDFTCHLLSGLFLLKLGALLSSAVGGQAVQVHIASFQLLHQLCHKDGCPDVVKGEDEDISTMSDASELGVVQALIKELP